MSVSVVKAENYEESSVLEKLERALEMLGLNPSNPFDTIVKQGDTVFIKPNWVAHRYRASCPYQYDVFTTITHPAVIKAVVRLVDKALNGNGKIIVGDNPSIDADFTELMKLQQLDSLHNEIKTPLEIIDLRPLICTDLKNYGHHDLMESQCGDPRGETTINLGKDSLLYGLNPRLFRGVFNNRQETVEAHTGENQLYSFSNSIFNADVYISVPKLKTHHKCGVTLNLKGLVGTVGIKNYLVHWREGFPGMGGDAYPSFWPWFADHFKKVKKRGAWAGNDTIWRMVVDLYSGIQRGPKRFFSVIDGILGGEGNGPFCPAPKEAGVLLAGTDLLETDVVATRLMGFNYLHVKYLNYLASISDIDISALKIHSDFCNTSGFFDTNNRHLDFVPPSRWDELQG